MSRKESLLVNGEVAMIGEKSFSVPKGIIKGEASGKDVEGAGRR